MNQLRSIIRLKASGHVPLEHQIYTKTINHFRISTLKIILEVHCNISPVPTVALIIRLTVPNWMLYLESFNYNHFKLLGTTNLYIFMSILSFWCNFVLYWAILWSLYCRFEQAFVYCYYRYAFVKLNNAEKSFHITFSVEFGTS